MITYFTRIVQGDIAIPPGRAVGRSKNRISVAVRTILRLEEARVTRTRW